jgi:G3E family GTPase
MTDPDADATDSTGDAEADPIRTVLVSGFLGAGKTTALQAIGAELRDRGHTVGMITNDQASGLVDTSILDAAGGEVVEIPGGCFCCNFDDLVTAAHSINKADVDVLLAEPVGSCTDLVATVVNPLRSLHSGTFDVAPLTVLVDPDRVRAYLDGDDPFPDPVQYIFRMQVEEADLIVLTKTDTLDDRETAALVERLRERVGDRPVLTLSATEGTGLERWLGALFDDPDGAAVDGDRADTVAARGRALTDIDYDTYAAGEAELGWVNTTVDLDGPLDAAAFRAALMERLQGALSAAGIEVAHLKFSVATDDALCHANLTATDGTPRYGGPDLGTVDAARLVVNVRAVGDPDEIESLVATAVDDTAGDDVGVAVERSQAFRPEYPEPVHRMGVESDD